jgi:hypothetical protein
MQQDDDMEEFDCGRRRPHWEVRIHSYLLRVKTGAAFVALRLSDGEASFATVAVAPEAGGIVARNQVGLQQSG